MTATQGYAHNGQFGLAGGHAVGYLRVSTVEQADERHSSLETQRSRVVAYCQSNGLTPIAEYTDIQSGRRDDRANYKRMIDFVNEGGADTVIVQFLDRFGRNPREILTRIWQLQEHNVRVVATDEDIREELVLLVRAGLAGAESKRTSERVRAYMGRSAEKGTHFGRVPYGYRPTHIDDDTIWQQEPTEAAIIRDMFRLTVTDNLGFKAICDVLNSQGRKTREGRPWAPSSLRHILKNEALAGTLLYGRRPAKGNPSREVVRVPGFLPAILDTDEWERLQERLGIRRESARGRTHASAYLLSGIARCAHCGGPMVGKVGGLRKHRNAQPGERYHNYWCGRAMQARELCAVYNGHSAPKLEAAILGHLGTYSDPVKVRELLAVSEVREADHLADELRANERRLAELESDFLKNLDLMKRGILDEQDFARANAGRKQERATLETRQAELTGLVQTARSVEAGEKSIPIQVRGFLEDFQSMETRKAKAILQTILKAAHVSTDGKIELEFRA